MVLTIVYTVITFGMNINSPVPKEMQKQEKIKLAPGTFFLVTAENTLGACLAAERPNNVRLVQKIPLFADEIAEVVTTRLIIPAAIGNPVTKNN